MAAVFTPEQIHNLAVAIDRATKQSARLKEGAEGLRASVVHALAVHTLSAAGDYVDAAVKPLELRIERLEMGLAAALTVLEARGIQG